jgi:hypothetical protein
MAFIQVTDYGSVRICVSRKCSYASSLLFDDLDEYAVRNLLSLQHYPTFCFLSFKRNILFGIRLLNSLDKVKII